MLLTIIEIERKGKESNPLNCTTENLATATSLIEFQAFP